MHLPRLHQIALMSLVVAAACKESTAPSTYAPPATLYWIEWTAAVAANQAESLRVSGGGVPCASIVWGTTVSGASVEVAAQVHTFNVPCPVSGRGADYDTVLVLPRLQSQTYDLFVPVPNLISFEPTEQRVGSFDVSTVPDPTTYFAGIASLGLDSLGCWRARPWSRPPAPQFALAQPPPLAATLQQFPAYIAGQLVTGSPPACGDAVALSASTLEIITAGY